MLRFRLRGGASDDKLRMTRVALVDRGGWKVSFFGTRFAVKRHLTWVLRGGEPLEDPSFRYFR